MNNIKTISFVIYAFLYILVIVIAIFCYLSVAAHSELTKIATPYLVIAYWLAFPIGIIAVYLTNKKLTLNVKNKRFMIISTLILSVAWGVLSLACIVIILSYRFYPDF